VCSPKLRAAVAALRRGADPAQARILQRFFKTGPGEYGAGDAFLGLRVPEVRRLARVFQDMPLADVGRLLASRFHEERLLALFVLVLAAEKADDAGRGRLCRFYLARTRHVNSWDLVDCSAPHIVGRHLESRDRAPLRRLAASRSLWERRIAVLATFHFIRRGEFAEALAIAERLVADREDLIHKAVGWMLREVGKRSRKAEEAFLRKHARAMPRTMLRYAVERFPEAVRQRYLRMR
jgi:3-methyladenine DNA glycosylase AlkD